MPLRQLRTMYEKRRMVLKDILDKDSKLDPKRKYEINGAIGEIDTLLKTIDNLREQEIEENSRLESKSIGRMSKGGIDLFKGFGEKINVKFNTSQSKQNLINIFVRKCESRAKFEYFAEQAHKDGLPHLEHIFQEVANNEHSHARAILTYLNLIRTTPENVKETSDIEHYYHSILYPEFEKVATREGFKEVAQFLNDLSQVDAEHEKIFLRMIKKINEKKLFSSDHVVNWKCKSCGYVTESKDAPKKCPVCKSGQNAFSIYHER